MTTRHIDHDQTKTVELTNKADHWILDKGVTVDVTDDAGVHIQGADNLTLTVEGRIHTVSDISATEAIWSQSLGTHILIADSGRGRITGYDGITFSTTGGRVINDGKIVLDDGNVMGIHAEVGGLSVRNNGLIEAETGVHAWGDGKVINGAGGVIESHTAVELSGDGGSTIVNRGTMTGSYLAIYTGDGDDHIVNRGKIAGDIKTGAGDDTIDLRHGQYAGELTGGAGNDTYYVDTNHLDIKEYGGDGFDTVWTTSDFTLEQAGYYEIEFVGAKGKDDVTLQGNFYDNILQGNSGRNDLVGDAGEDTLSSGAGDDWMQGGADTDTFVFRKGDGHDTIADFKVGSDFDVLDIHFLKDFKTMDDLKDVAKDTADGLVLNFGHGDCVTIEGMTASDLDDFDIRFAL